MKITIANVTILVYDGASRPHGRHRGVRVPKGSTLLKRRLLKRAGWRVITVPFFEWDEMCDEGAQREYLRTKLGL